MSLHIPISYFVDSDQSLTLRNATNVRQYIQNIKVIDNQKKLTQLSRAIERWHTAKTAFFTSHPAPYWRKNDWWNPWSPYVWLIGGNSHTLCQASAAWTVISRALAGNMLTFPFDALSGVLIWLLWLFGLYLTHYSMSKEFHFSAAGINCYL